MARIPSPYVPPRRPRSAASSARPVTREQITLGPDELAELDAKVAAVNPAEARYHASRAASLAKYPAPKPRRRR
jgi:hypothetical protein